MEFVSMRRDTTADVVRGTGIFGVLHDDTMRMFFGHLSAKSLLRCFAVCKAWRSWAASPDAWNAVYCTMYRKGQPLPEELRARDEQAGLELYKRRYCQLGRESQIETGVVCQRRADNAFDVVNNSTSELQWFDESVESIRSANPLIPILPPGGQTKSILYFEARVFGGSSVGMCCIKKNYGAGMHCHVGWRPRSYGYHSDDGKFFWNEGTQGLGGQCEDFATPYGYAEEVRVHQTVGCGLDVERGELFFTLDGKLLGAPRRGLARGRFYAAVGLHEAGDRFVCMSA